MARYVVERTLPDGWSVSTGAHGSEQCAAIVDRNSDDGVTWLHSYVSDDGAKTFCVYEAPTPEAIRKTAKRNGLPVDRITQVRVLDPYFYFEV
jgi:Nickel responsive protein SCO4226-like